MKAVDHRRVLLRAALGFSAIRWHSPPPPAARALASYMDSWRGLGDVVVGMLRHDFEVVLSGGSDGWSATFLKGRPEGGAPEVVGTAHDAQASRAVQVAARVALREPSG